MSTTKEISKEIADLEIKITSLQWRKAYLQGRLAGAQQLEREGN